MQVLLYLSLFQAYYISACYLVKFCQKLILSNLIILCDYFSGKFD
jgi:hypothetical protein